METSRRAEKASDMELTMFLIGHINDPCEDPQGNSRRKFYIKEAQRALATFKNPEARQLLTETIQKYSTYPYTKNYE